jgi:hypothetical protein
MSAWIPVLTQVTLGLLTIIGSGVVVHKLNAGKDQREFTRTKLEALFVAVQEFDQFFLKPCIPGSPGIRIHFPGRIRLIKKIPL